MPNNMTWIVTARALACLVALTVAGVVAGQDAAPPSSTPQATVNKGQQDTVTDGPEPENTVEETIESAATGRPTLDYEPTESISEDSSVSFPVDI